MFLTLLLYQGLCYFSSLTYRYSPQHFVSSDPQYMIFPPRDSVSQPQKEMFSLSFLCLERERRYSRAVQSAAIDPRFDELG
jgi:hypothetical protein